GAFLVKDSAWAMLFRTCARRLTSLKVRFVGFGPVATRALAIHCTQLVELRISECIDFDDDCLAILAVPITDYEEEEQETERVLRLLNERSKKGKAASVGSPKDCTGPIPSWQPLSCLQSLDLARPHKPMSSQTTARVIRTVGSQLRVLDLSGFKDIDDSFLLNALDANCQNLQELYLNECNGISPAAMAQFFASQRGKAMVANNGYRRVGLERCYMLTDSVIQELVLHSGATLTWLNINSVDDNLSNYGLLALAGSIYNRTTDPESGTSQYILAEQTSGCVNLEELDLSWVRCTADAVLEDVLATCKKLETIKTYGCPDITAFAPKRPGLRYIGRECDTL
ncbi:UV-damaged DNA-binding protein rad7, partial [Kickxella alabastrina]